MPLSTIIIIIIHEQGSNVGLPLEVYGLISFNMRFCFVGWLVLFLFFFVVVVVKSQLDVTLWYNFE